jgi:hypothetical protein
MKQTHTTSTVCLESHCALIKGVGSDVHEHLYSVVLHGIAIEPLFNN